MISREQFGRLRLSTFLPAADLAELEEWEFEDRVWVGEALGFSEWLRPADDPESLGSLSIDFARFPEDVAGRVLEAIGLPIRAGTDHEGLRDALGEPEEVCRLVPDQVDYEFRTDGPEPYRISCTVRDEGGLSYLVVMPRTGADEDGA